MIVAHWERGAELNDDHSRTTSVAFSSSRRPTNLDCLKWPRRRRVHTTTATPAGATALAEGVADRHRILPMRFEKIWVEQCQATRAIKRRFGAKSALDYLIGEKLLTFAKVARDHPEFAAELPKFLAAIYRVFNQFEIAGYVASRKPAARRVLRQLLLTP